MLTEQSFVMTRPDPTVQPVDLFFIPFSPAECADITGCPAGTQRSFRARGMLHTNPGDVARFDVFGMVYTGILHTLGRKGLATAVKHGRDISIGICWHALHEREAYSGDFDRILEWDTAALAGIEETAAATAFLQKPGLSLPEAMAEMKRLGPGNGFNARSRADWLRRQIFTYGSFEPAPRFYVIFGDGTGGQFESLDDAFGGLSDDPRYQFSSIVIDFEAEAARLLDRASASPFVNVTVATR
jgi:hypothetical protein